MLQLSRNLRAYSGTAQCISSITFNRLFSTTKPTQGTKAIKFLKAQRRRQRNEIKQTNLKKSADMVDPVFGHKDTPFIVRIQAELKEPNVLSHGYEGKEVDKFLAAVDATEREQAELSGLNMDLFETTDAKIVETRKEVILRILNMRNADNQESMKMALRLAREEFQRFPGDTGSSEVQAACMTVKIFNMAHHVQEHKKDFANTRLLRILVQKRQNILQYLKRDNPEKYYWAIEKLGLTDAAVTEEFNLDRRYMQDYKFFGDKILIKDSKKTIDAQRRNLRTQKMIENLE
ncbi:similar to Saccharomyces cerevisiae YDR337W MRPS28 Mitochondrial ribosomal protein of the small subunit [Maudiozyma saulgeensis]|uniref:Similar to Saccharomyces cerevisiae YDR337W MRPS28 Mitochondrial ribosomal protein of the small subunit n=1 Tax=Maudiozyma saulgeensis TaxID=1789683 RepID=A0A1X7R1Z5_9SACH|nr:similar to Saccharomyces cerevisiae YDR337W MRPS28 Mitochondrial ribosomal protein of the small subunit [Kazachstania saulgeensis]